MPVKSFRGKLSNNSIETINLSTNNGSVGYRIVKFQLMGINENTAYENTVKIYKIPQATATEDIDFSDNTLLAAALYGDSSDSKTFAVQTIIFDNEVFNQDIFITYIGQAGFQNDINYHIELEQIKLDLNENTVATLKDIRNIKSN
mgnify:CR=1 FL=1|tara:strand:+ start:209 stop:646 length:438 start_codon:yes stop_codon:yes gene_type:complete